MRIKSFCNRKASNVIDFSGNYLLDANVLRIVGDDWKFTRSKDSKINSYGILLKKIKERQGNLYISPIIISEISNLILRKGYESHIELNKKAGRNFKNFKDFLKTETGKQVVCDASTTIRGFVRAYNFCEDWVFSLSDVDRVFDLFRSTNASVQDIVIRETCLRNNLFLITDDSDFLRFDGMTILTYKR